MSTTLTTLEVDTTIMREHFSDVFNTDYSVSKLTNLKKSIAKEHLKRDLYVKYEIDSSETSELTILDEIIDKYATQFQAALMYLQCYYFFVENDDVDGKNAVRKSMCSQSYESLKSEWKSYYTSNRYATTTMLLGRG
jgi:hypothetical protein